MLGLGRGNHKPVVEHEADGDTDRIFHEIRNTLRVSGVSLAFRLWAGHDKFFPILWTACGPNAETLAFERAGDQVREQGVRAAESLGKLDVAPRVRLGESQLFQLKAALDLYRYINPKLLVLASAVKLALDGEPIGRRQNGDGGLDRLELGIPRKMAAMELIAEEPDDRRLRELFEDVRKTLSFEMVPSDFRTIALWPEFVTAAWEKLKAVMKREKYALSCDELRDKARSLARALPYPIPITKSRIIESGADAEAIVRLTANIERLLPGLIIGVSMIGLDLKPSDELSRSPFPPELRRSFERVQGGVS
jgi:hypothetical protein